MLKYLTFSKRRDFVDLIPNLFWTCLLVYVYAKMSAFFRIALLKEFSIEKIVEDRSLRFYNAVALLSLNLTGFLGLIVIGVSIHNIFD